MWRSRETLAEYGVVYPDNIIGEWYNSDQHFTHAFLADALRKGELMKHLDAIIGHYGNKYYFFSSEDFIQMGPPRRDQLVKVLETRFSTINVILYLRDPASLVVSHAAQMIARPFEAAVIRSDVVRKELARSAKLNSTELYVDETTQRTYAEVLARALRELEHGRTAIADATFLQAEHREQFVESARERGIPYLLVEVTCDDETVHARMRHRAGDPREISDADWKVYLDAKQRFESPTEIDAAHRLRIASGQTPERTASLVIEQLLTIC